MVSSRVRLGEGLIERERVVELASAIALLVALALVVVVERLANSISGSRLR